MSNVAIDHLIAGGFLFASLTVFAGYLTPVLSVILMCMGITWYSFEIYIKVHKLLNEHKHNRRSDTEK